MKMRIVAVVLAATSVACDYAAPGAGEEIVLVHKPYVFGHGGVDPVPVKTGATLIWPSTEELKVNMQPRTFILHFDDMFTSDGVPLDFDVAVRLRVTDSVRMAAEFGVWEYDKDGKGTMWPGWFGNNLMKPIETFVRQAVRKHGLNETAINPVAVDEIDAEIHAAIEGEIRRIKLPAALEGFTVGRAAPPDAIENQRIATAEQQQRKLTEAMRREAEDARLAAESSRAQADRAYMDRIGMSADEFIRLAAINMQERACAKGGCTFVVGGLPALVNAR